MIKKINWNGFDAIEFAAGGYEALLIPAMGANVVRLRHAVTGAEILRTPKADEIDTFRERPQLFGLPLLFPPNRIEDGRYSYGGRSYQFPITIPAQNNFHHGTIKSQPFVISNCADSEGVVEIEAVFFSNCVNDGVYAYFPHEFECRMCFRLSADGLEHTVFFLNHSADEMPLGVGYHTPLNLPFIAGSDPSGHRLRLSVGERWELNERTLPTGKFLPLSDFEKGLRSPEGILPIGQPIESAFTAEPLTIDGKPYNGAILTDTASGRSVYYEVDGQMRDWTLWNNGGEVSWMCPEPQTWAINAPNLKLPAEKTGFQTVKPGAKWSSTAKIYLK